MAKITLHNLRHLEEIATGKKLNRDDAGTCEFIAGALWQARTPEVATKILLVALQANEKVRETLLAWFKDIGIEGEDLG